MTAKPTTIISKQTKRWLLWLLMAFGVAIVVMLIVYWRKQQAASAKLKNKPTTPAPPIPVQPPVNLPGKPEVPGLPTSVPTQVLDVHWAYIQELAWKAKDTFDGKTNNDYVCELTNGVVEMGDVDLKYLVALYKQWYNGDFVSDFCGKITYSYCWSSLWDGKPKKACDRLKNLK